MPVMGTLEELGPRTREKLLKAFGSEEGIIRAAEALELDRFVAVRGISQRKAVDIICRLLGMQDFAFLRTPAAQAVYDDIVRRIRGYARTSYGKNKVLLLRPLREMRAREVLLKRVMAWKEMARQLPRERIAAVMGQLRPLREPKPVFDSSKVVVVEDAETLRQLEPFSRYCEVVMPRDLDRPEDFDLILYVCTSGNVDIEGLDQVHTILGRPEPWQVFPESVVDFFRANQAVLQVLSELGQHVSGLGVAKEVIDILEGLKVESPQVNEDVLDEVLRDLNGALKERLSRLSLEGPEVLELLQRGLPRRVREVFAEVLEEGEEEILRRTGLRISLEATFPLTLPEEEVGRAVRELRRMARLKGFEVMQKVARLLISREPDVRVAHGRALEFDFEVALGSFALDYDLQPPRWDNELRLRGALHLDLVNDPAAQRVDYCLSGDEKVALLTGANSGGKTTLLETLAQVWTMATMGLPVCAREAVLEPVDACYFFSRQGSLSAGALEGFLTTFMPLALDERKKIVLADELEAMTEPEAAAAIVATFLEQLKGSESYAVVVTHEARSILQRTDVRVDGIEAQGLDENYNLIVDRTPKRSIIARSTPELILQRLMALEKGKRSQMYRAVLKKLRDFG